MEQIGQCLINNQLFSLGQLSGLYGTHIQKLESTPSKLISFERYTVRFRQNFVLFARKLVATVVPKHMAR